MHTSWICSWFSGREAYVIMHHNRSKQQDDYSFIWQVMPISYFRYMVLIFMSPFYNSSCSTKYGLWIGYQHRDKTSSFFLSCPPLCVLFSENVITWFCYNFFLYEDVNHREMLVLFSIKVLYVTILKESYKLLFQHKNHTTCN